MQGRKKIKNEWIEAKSLEVVQAMLGNMRYVDYLQ
jgi:hypothetical protein